MNGVGLIQLGEYGELWINVEHIESVDGIPEQRGGHVVKPVKFVGSAVRTRSGATHTVPQDPDKITDTMMRLANLLAGR